MPSMIRLAAAVAAFGFAATLAPTTVEAQMITACYTNKNGTMYRVGTPNTPANCTSSSHVKEVWNVQGLPGPTGANGVSGFQRVVKAIAQGPTLIAPDFYYVPCPSGKVAIGAGYDQVNSSPNEQEIFVTSSSPSDNEGTWRFGVRNVGNRNIALNLHVICAFAN